MFHVNYMAVLVAAIVVLGVYPDLLFKITDPGVTKVVHQIAAGVT